MKKTLAGLGVLALVAVGATGASFPASAASVQPVAEIVAESDAIVASPDAILVQSEPVVTTTPAEIVAEPVAVVAEPVVASEPVYVAPVASEPVAVVTEPVAVDPYSGNPIVDCEAQGLVTAEDASCVSATFYTEPVAGSTANTVPADPSQLQLGDAWAGAGAYYQNLRDEAATLKLKGYIATQDASATQREGFEYTPSVIDPTKVHVSVPVWTVEDKAIPSSTWDTRTPEQVAAQEANQPAAELFTTK